MHGYNYRNIIEINMNNMCRSIVRKTVHVRVCLLVLPHVFDSLRLLLHSKDVNRQRQVLWVFMSSKQLPCFPFTGARNRLSCDPGAKLY